MKTRIKKGVIGIHLEDVIFLVYFVFLMRGGYTKLETALTFLSMVLWYFIAALSSRKGFNQIISSKEFCLIIAFTIFTFMINIFYHGTSAFGGYAALNSLLFGVPAFLYYSQAKSRKVYSLYKIILIIWLYFCLKACFIYFQNPGIARALVSDQRYAYGNIAIGNPYGLAAGSSFIAVALLDRMMIVRKFQIKNLLILAVLLINVIWASSTITIIGTFLGMCAVVYVRFFLNKKGQFTVHRFLFFIIFTALLLVLCFAVRHWMGYLILSVTENATGIVTLRLRELGHLLALGEESRDIGVRFDLLLQSAEVIVKNPILGVRDLSIEGAGNHGELLDIFAENGLILGSVYYAIVIYALKRERRLCKGIISGMYIVTLLVIAALNPVSYPQAFFALFFMVPMFGLREKLREGVKYS